MTASLEHLIFVGESWLAIDPDEETRRELAETLDSAQAGNVIAAQKLKQRFSGRLEFGTAGLRGPLGFGPRAMNRVIVQQTTAALGTHFISEALPNSIALRAVIGFDSRKNSRVFAHDVAETLSGLGIYVLLSPQAMPTPVISFGVRQLGCDFGVMITASHNEAGDNGYKVFIGGDEGGSQILPETARAIDERARRTDFQEIHKSNTWIFETPPQLPSNYIDATITSSLTSLPEQSNIRVVYSAFHGVGGEIFTRTLSQAGFSDLHLVQQQFEPDQNFPTLRFPNPEEKGAMSLCFEEGRKVDADIIIAHDPDADRVAVALPDKDSPEQFRMMSGNQLGIILGWHAAEQAKNRGISGVLATSVVSSPALSEVAKHFSLGYVETLPGFKHLSRVRGLIFGFEEALGYLVNPEVVRDKDGISAGLVSLALANSLLIEGLTLWDQLAQIEKIIGSYASSQLTRRLEVGSSGSEVMSMIRHQSLKKIGKLRVKRVEDFHDGLNNLRKADIVRLHFWNESRVTVRPSGTESKLKIYFDCRGPSREVAEATVAETEANINYFLESIGVDEYASTN